MFSIHHSHGNTSADCFKVDFTRDKHLVMQKDLIIVYFVHLQKYQNGEVDDEEQFLNALRSSIEIFCNRMRSNQARGRSIANDSSVQTLFMTINTMHPQLMEYMQKQEESRCEYNKADIFLIFHNINKAQLSISLLFHISHFC